MRQWRNHGQIGRPVAWCARQVESCSECVSKKIVVYNRVTVNSKSKAAYIVIKDNDVHRHVIRVRASFVAPPF